MEFHHQTIIITGAAKASVHLPKSPILSAFFVQSKHRLMNIKVWHQGPFNFANGMALSDDGTREIFVTLPQTCPDGLAFDNKGNLYISCYAPNRIYKITPGKTIEILLDDWEDGISVRSISG